MITNISDLAFDYPNHWQAMQIAPMAMTRDLPHQSCKEHLISNTPA